MGESMTLAYQLGGVPAWKGGVSGSIPSPNSSCVGRPTVDYALVTELHIQ
jgi:hypothetical protein